MCGIAGILGPNASPERIERMVQAQRHRGPDDEGLVVVPTEFSGIELALGHRRLAILDLSAAGHQPMQDPESGRWVVFNGEIFNHLDLRRELGGTYHSTCDTETLLRAFGRWGQGAPDRFRGMFAFAIWDPAAQELFLCRDRLGIKPLYYAQVGTDFIFASELRAILSTGLVPRRLDPAGLNGYLAFGHVPEPNTIIRGIQLVPAGHWLRVSPVEGIRELHRYWTPPYRRGENGVNGEAPAAAVRRLLDEAVDCRLLSDVPLGAFLSGGVDSSAIVASMSGLNHKAIRTFTIDFTEKGYGEGPHAERLAARYGTQHTTERVSPDDLLAQFDEGLEAADQPSIDGVNTYYVCKLARESGLTVALCGHGGDELFGGYDNFRLIPRVLGLGTLPKPLRSLMEKAVQHFAPARVSTRKAASLLGSCGDGYSAYAIARSIFWDELQVGFLERPEDLVPAAEFVKATVPPDEAADDAFNLVSQLELCFYLRNSLLRDADVCSMAHGLELRVPLLDHHLVEYVTALPTGAKNTSGPAKPLLIKAMGADLPEEVGLRRKQGFVIPYQNWLQGALRSRLDAVLTSADHSQAIGLRPDQVARIWSDYLQGFRGINMQHPLSLYVLLNWCARHGVTL